MPGACAQAVDPVLIGKVRAKQYYSNDAERSRNMGMLLHGDGSFAGQGVVYETLDMSALPDYTVGGCIHLVVNNQVCVRRASGSERCLCGNQAYRAILHLFRVAGITWMPTACGRTALSCSACPCACQCGSAMPFAKIETAWMFRMQGLRMS